VQRCKKQIYDIAVFTNHGLSIKNAGYTHGKRYMSSLLRKELAYNEIKKVKNSNEILKCLNKNYINLNPGFHTYRNKNNTKAYLDVTPNNLAFNTVSQTLMCLSELTFYFNYDSENCNFVKYDNRLPTNYTPKITVFINQISKCKTLEPMPFDNLYIDNIIENHMFKCNNILLYCIILIIIMYVYLLYFNE